MVLRFTARTLRSLAPAALGGLAASVLLLGFMIHLEKANTEARFHELAHQRIVAIRASISIALESVGLIAGHFAVAPGESTSRAAFRTLVSGTLENQGFIQAFSWDPLIARQDAPAFEARARADGLEGFALMERGADGQMAPVSEREEYVPVYYVEPLARNVQALGFDLASNPVRKRALDTARDTGLAQVTGRIKLVQEKGDHYGVLVLAPVFGVVGTGDVKHNRATLRGYVSGVFRIGDLISASRSMAHDTGDEPHMDIQLLDLSAADDEQALYSGAKTANVASFDPDLVLTEDFDVAGRRWRLIATPSAAFLEGAWPVASLAVFAVSLVALVLFLLVLKGRIDQFDRAASFAREIGRAKRRLSEAQRVARLASMELDPRDNMVGLSDGFTRLLGLPENMSEAPLSAMLANVHPEDRDTVRMGLATHGTTEGFDFRVAQDGEIRTMHAMVSDINDSGHRPVTLQDVTARKANEERTRRLEYELVQAQKLEAIGTLAGGIAHEINTPIQYIGDNLSFIREATGQLQSLISMQKTLVEAAGETKELATLAQSCATFYEDCDMDFLAGELPNAIEQSDVGVRQVAGIVRAMKEFSHPSSKSKAPVNLNRIAERAALICKSEWKHVAKLDFDLETNLPSVDGIEGELNQVVLNLLVNAAHAIQAKDAGIGAITVRTRTEDRLIRLDVEDSGTGISDRIRDKIFEPFFTTKDVGKGTGQGLAICRDIVVNKHGGRLEFSSNPGAGTVFSMILPNTADRAEPVIRH